MSSKPKRLLAAALALLLALGAPLSALAAEVEVEPSETPGSSAELLEITVPDYIPSSDGVQMGDVSRIQKGGLYTLIVLPAKDAADGSAPKALTAQLLTTSEPLFIGSAVATDNGSVKFTNIRLRTAEAAVYYVTGPGLDTPLAEATSLSVSTGGLVYRTSGQTKIPIPNAKVSLVDTTTGYAYANSALTDNSGVYDLSLLSPGKYFLHVEKPGYLPATSKEFSDINDGSSHYREFDLAPYLGDVNNNGVRDLNDLTDLLFCYENTVQTIPDGLTPDLSGDGLVNISDVALYLSAASAAGELTLGTGFPADVAAAQSSIFARDDGSASQTNRSLVFAMDNGGLKGLTFTAASVSLSFRTDYIQPINQNGGAISPSNPSAAASCLSAASGVTISNAAWSVTGDVATLTFTLSCKKPTALTKLAEFRYRPAPGKTIDDFFQGVFTVDHLAAQIGGASVVTGCALEYPNSAPLDLDSISIDLTDTTIIIPSSGQTVLRALTASGAKGSQTYPNLSGVTWSMSGQTQGVSISDGLLTIDHRALAGQLILTATLGDLTSPPLTLTLQNAPRAPRSVVISQDNTASNQYSLSGAAGQALTFPFQAQVLDQYNVPMTDQTVVWSLSGAPSGITVTSDGAVSVADHLPAGTYTFSLHAALDDLRAAVNITLTLEAVLDHLVLSGPASAQIPFSSSNLTLSYILSAVDAQGRVIPKAALSPTFTLVQPSGAEGARPGVTPDVDLSGNLTVIISPSAQPGEYTLHAAASGKTVEFTLTLHPAQEASPARAALSYEGRHATSFSVSIDETDLSSANLEFSGLLLNGADQAVTPSQASWKFSFSRLPAQIQSSASGADLTLQIDSDIPFGVHFFTITAKELISGLSVTVPVELTIVPAIANLDLNAPESLTIPSGDSLRYTFQANATNSNGDSISLPDGLVWQVTDTEPTETTTAFHAPDGVTLEKGVLTVTSAAKPGTIYILVHDSNGLRLTATPITLVSGGADKVLALRRDGELLTGGVDAIYGKEGSALSLTYTPVLLDRATGAVTVLTKDFTWRGLTGTFSVDSKTESGVYSAPITVLYGNQSVSLTAQITVYPNIRNIYMTFDEGDSDPIANAYAFPVPVNVSKTYYATVMAHIIRGGKAQYVPLSQLNLTDYSLDIYVPMLNGIYTVYDQSTGRLALTIEPLASSNSMDPPTIPGADDHRVLYIDFSYYPDDKPMELDQTFMLTRESSTVTTALLRQGAGVGSKFAFETTRDETTIQTTPGTLSDCFALELLDQYGDPVTNQYVSWGTGLQNSPKDSSGKDLVTLVDPGKSITTAYPRYQSLRRLRIDPNTPSGTYDLTLTVGCGPTNNAAVNSPTFTRSLTIHLTVDPPQSADAVRLTGPAAAVIPKYYAQPGSNKANTETRTLFYVAAVTYPDGTEADSSLYTFTWQVANESGGKPAGVSIKSNADNPATATVTIDRNAQSTTTLDKLGNPVRKPLHIIVTATAKSGGDSFQMETDLTLNRETLLTYLLEINGPSSYTLEPGAKDVTQLYTFTLKNQYDDPITSISDAVDEAITWSWRNQPSYVTMTKTSDSKGHSAVQLKLRTPSEASPKVTMTITASITILDSTAPSGKRTLTDTLSIPITIGDYTGGGLGPMGGLDPSLGQDQPPATNAATVTPTTSKTGTTGTVTLSQEEVDTLANTTATGTLSIVPTGTTGLTSLTTTFPASLSKAMADKSSNQSLRILTSLGTVTIPKETLRQLGTKSGNISVTLLNQNGTVSVSFRAGGAAITNLSGQILLQAPVSGNTVLNSQNEVIKKAVVTNGQIATYVTGDTQFKIETRGKVFSDTQDSWAKNAVIFVTARELFNGTSETTFSPGGDMTRGMVVTVLHRLENTPATSAANLFRDVPDGTWFTDAVVWANAQGIVQGTGDGFSPNAPVTREQLATILYRYMNTMGYNTAKRSSLTAFSDSARVSSWAKDAMEWAVASGIISGKSGGLLDPGGNASRAEVATMLERLIVSMVPTV